MPPVRLASLRPEPRRRVIVLALDGVSGAELERAMQGGHATVLADTLAAVTRLRPTYPAHSIVEWASFMTASNPGRHGVFSLVQPDQDYRPLIPSASDLKMPTLWDRAAIDGLQSVVVNLPGTYPARRMTGRMVAGAGAPGLDLACYPASIARRLREAGYLIDVDPALASKAPDAFGQHVLDVLERRIAGAERLLAGSRWGLAVLAFTELDRFEHLRTNGASPGGEARAVREAWFRSIDALAGRLMDKYRGARLMVVSGHGLAPVTRQVNVARWLETNGYSVRDDSGPSNGSVALTVDGSLVYLNARRIFRRGTLDQGTIAPLVEEISHGLRELIDPDTGRRPIRAVLHRRDVYTGPYYRVAPHIVCVAEPGFLLVGSRAAPLFAPAPYAADHRAEDGFVAADVSRASGASLADAGATVLDWLGLYGGDVDGTPLARPRHTDGAEDG